MSVFALWAVAVVVMMGLVVYFGVKEGDEAKAGLESLLVRLRSSPTDRSIHGEITRFILLKRGSLPGAGSTLYSEVLTILEKHPDDVGVRDFALQVGRWHYSTGRPDGKPTVYDEQAILNDMMVRSTPGRSGRDREAIITPG